MLDFEWDEEKRRSNIAKHGVDFKDAIAVFRDDLGFDFIDDRDDYGEIRMALIGRVGMRFLVVIYTDRGDEVRIISARHATKAEQDAYFKNQS
jgi:uncharacterized protein